MTKKWRIISLDINKTNKNEVHADNTNLIYFLFIFILFNVLNNEPKNVLFYILNKFILLYYKVKNEVEKTF